MRAGVDAAIASARTGEGPRLIEAVTYRLSDHTTADDASRYRPAEEVKERWKEEPIVRLRTYLVSRMNWSKKEEEKVTGECEERVETAIKRYLRREAALGQCQTLLPVDYAEHQHVTTEGE